SFPQLLVYFTERLMPRATLSPYTTLFRSPGRCRPAGAGPPASGGDGRPTRPRGDLPGRGGLPSRRRPAGRAGLAGPSTGPSPPRDRKSTRLNSSHVKISYAVFCLKNTNVD